MNITVQWAHDAEDDYQISVDKDEIVGEIHTHVGSGDMIRVSSPLLYIHYKNYNLIINFCRYSRQN